MTESASSVSLMLGDCLERLRELPDNSVDSVVTDPPYGLSFMGKKWDYDVPSVEVWKECLRVLKPGGHLLAFAGTRTQHRMAVRIEDAGFEIRDMIAWCYGSGFPKSLDVSKAIDKAAGAEREVVGIRQLTGYGKANVTNGQQSRDTTEFPETSRDPATPDAARWQGWGTALKPALESLTYATKPLDCLWYCSKMIANLNEKIELCRQIVNNAEKSLRHFQAASQEEKTNTVPESAAIPTEEVQESPTGIGKADATSSRADTSESTPEMEPTDLNTLLSWRNTLGDVFDVMRTSTTATVFETITDWKILSYCLSQITPDTITKARSNPSGLSADALRAVEYLNVSLACCANTLSLSALAPAMSQEAERCRDAGVSPNLDLITVARKPLGEKTVAANVLAHGTGAINVDGCRVGITVETWPASRSFGGFMAAHKGTKTPTEETGPIPPGRWPANLILTYPEDEFILMDGVTPDQLHTLANWLNENSKH